MKKNSKNSVSVKFRVGKYTEGSPVEWITEEQTNLITEWGLSVLDKWWFCDMTSYAILGTSNLPNTKSLGVCTYDGVTLSGENFEESDVGRLVKFDDGSSVTIDAWLNSSSQIQVTPAAQAPRSENATLLYTDQDTMDAGVIISNNYDTTEGSIVNSKTIALSASELVNITNTRSIVFPELVEDTAFKEIGWTPNNNNGPQSKVFGRKVIDLPFVAGDRPFVQVSIERLVMFGVTDHASIPILYYVDGAKSKYTFSDPEFNEDHYSSIAPDGSTIPPKHPTLLENAGIHNRHIYCLYESSNIDSLTGHILGTTSPTAWSWVSGNSVKIETVFATTRIDPEKYLTVSEDGVWHTIEKQVTSDRLIDLEESSLNTGVIIGAAELVSRPSNGALMAYIKSDNSVHGISDTGTGFVETSPTPAASATKIVNIEPSAITTHPTLLSIFGVSSVITVFQFTPGGIITHEIDIGIDIVDIATVADRIVVVTSTGHYQVYGWGATIATLVQQGAILSKQSPSGVYNLISRKDISSSEPTQVYDTVNGMILAIDSVGIGGIVGTIELDDKDVQNVVQHDKYTYVPSVGFMMLKNFDFNAIGNKLVKQFDLRNDYNDILGFSYYRNAKCLFEANYISGEVGSETYSTSMGTYSMSSFPKTLPKISMVDNKFVRSSRSQPLGFTIQSVGLANGVSYIMSVDDSPGTPNKMYCNAVDANSTPLYQAEVTTDIDTGFFTGVCTANGTFVTTNGYDMHRYTESTPDLEHGFNLISSPTHDATPGCNFSGIALVNDTLLLAHVYGTICLYFVTENQVVAIPDSSIPVNTIDTRDLKRNALHFDKNTNKAHFVLGQQHFIADLNIETQRLTNYHNVTIIGGHNEIASGLFDSMLHVATEDGRVRIYDVSGDTPVLYITKVLDVLEITSGIDGVVYKTASGEMLEQYLSKNGGFYTNYSAPATTGAILHQINSDAFATSDGSSYDIYTKRNLAPGVSEDRVYVNLNEEGSKRGISRINKFYLANDSGGNKTEIMWGVKLDVPIDTANVALSNLTFKTTWIR